MKYKRNRIGNIFRKTMCNTHLISELVGVHLKQFELMDNKLFQ